MVNHEEHRVKRTKIARVRMESPPAHDERTTTRQKPYKRVTNTVLHLQWKLCAQMNEASEKTHIGLWQWNKHSITYRQRRLPSLDPSSVKLPKTSHRSA